MYVRRCILPNDDSSNFELSGSTIWHKVVSHKKFSLGLSETKKRVSAILMSFL